MELKKNPKKDINNKSGVYFAIGLVTVMLLAYVALEWKTYETDYDINIGMNELDDDVSEDAPIFQLATPPPPKVPTIPTKIEVVEDEDPVEETFIEAVDPNQDTEVLDHETISVIEDEPEPEVNWVTIEEVPVFPGCENASDKRACFGEKMQQHVRKVFRYPELEQEMGIQGKVNVMFDINKDGTIGNIRKRGPNGNLENEAVRIIEKLPKMTPGKQRDQNVKVSFSIPITFKLQ